MPSSSHTLDRMQVTFDDEHAVGEAGLLLPATLAQHLGLEAAADALVGVGHRPGRKLLTVVQRVTRGRRLHRRRRRAARRRDPAGARSSGDGPVHGRVVAARLHVRTRPPARQARRARADRRVDDWRGTRPRGSRSPSTWTPRSARRTATKSRVRRSATTGGAATTRCSRPAPRAARCCTPACARGRRTPAAARNASSARPSAACAAPALTARSCYAPTPGSGRPRCSPPAVTTRCGSRSPCAAPPKVLAAIAAIHDDAWTPIDYTGRGEAQVAETTPRRQAADRATHQARPRHAAVIP